MVDAATRVRERVQWLFGPVEPKAEAEHARELNPVEGSAEQHHQRGDDLESDTSHCDMK